MNVVPAQVAGVRSIALASPPQRTTAACPHPTILAACALLGVDEVYAVGGAQAIAMFAYGAGPCRRVDLVTGPGNIYTVAAKRLLKGVVGIDSEAGPTEIAILADDSADPAYVAADLISQAEHDTLAGRVLVTDLASGWPTPSRPSSRTQVHATNHTERIRTALGGRQSAIVLVDDLEQGLAVVDAYAAEHLEIQTEDAADRGRPGAQRRRDLRRLVRAGVARRLLRRLQPRAAHRRLRLPLLRAVGARRSCKAVHVVDYDRDALAEVADHVVTLAEAEDLPAHGAAVTRPVRADERPRPAAAAGRPARPGAVRRAAARRPRPAQRQREPLPAVPAGRRRHRGARSPRPRGELNRYPDREVVGAARRPWRRTSAHGDHGRRRCGPPTGPTR